MAAGYGLTPYGIGDWGSENSFVPGTGAIGITGHAPIVDSGVIPTGATVIVGSAPVVVVIEKVKTPGTATVNIVGQAPTVIEDIRRTPDTKDLDLVGFAPTIDTRIIPATVALNIVDQTGSLDIGVKPGTAGEMVRDAF